MLLGNEAWELEYFRTGWEGGVRIHSVQTAGEVDKEEDSCEDQGEMGISKNLVLPLSALQDCCWLKDVFVLKNVTANHRVNDAVFNEDGLQVVMGRFMYGPLDMVTLTGEKVSAL